MLLEASVGVEPHFPQASLSTEEFVAVKVTSHIYLVKSVNE